MDGTMIRYTERWKLPGTRKIIVPTESHLRSCCAEALVFE